MQIQLMLSASILNPLGQSTQALSMSRPQHILRLSQVCGERLKPLKISF